MQALRTGDWLTNARALRFAVVMLAVTAASILYLLATANGTVDAWGRPVGTDFSNVWTAGRMALEGRSAEAWSWPAHYRVQQLLHGRADIPFYGWHYPPPFLLIAGLLAMLPYMPALLLWQGVTALAATAMARRIVPHRDTLLIALGFPAVFVCLTHGQNGFLTAALLGGGILALERKPLLAGVMIGCLCYKPQFAPVLPVLLLVGGHYRAFASAAATVLALIALTLAIWGWPVWEAFFQSLALTRGTVIENAETGAHRIVSAFAAVRLNGGSVASAYIVQGIVSAAAVIGIIVARKAPPRIQAAGACAAALLATPYAFDYDMVVLGIGIAFLAAEALERGWRAWEKTGLALAYVAPLIARSVAEVSGFPLGLIAILAVSLLAIRRALQPAVVIPSPCHRSHAAFVP